MAGVAQRQARAEPSGVERSTIKKVATYGARLGAHLRPTPQAHWRSPR